jgi:hypothetical protein
VDEVDVGAVVADLQRRVAARRAAGDYPPGLEEQLEAEFKIIMGAVHRDEIGTSDLQRRVWAVASSTHAVRSNAESSSRVPGGSVVHSATSKLVQRHTGLLADSVRVLGHEIAAALQEVVRLFEVQRHADERQLNEVIASLIDRLAVVDHLADAVVDLERRLDLLESKA